MYTCVKIERKLKLWKLRCHSVHYFVFLFSSFSLLFERLCKQGSYKFLILKFITFPDSNFYTILDIWVQTARCLVIAFLKCPFLPLYGLELRLPHAGDVKQFARVCIQPSFVKPALKKRALAESSMMLRCRTSLLKEGSKLPVLLLFFFNIITYK